MKKILAGGVKNIFQLAQVFRNQERSRTHHPEFTMLEWYRAFENYTVLMKDCENILRASARAIGGDGFFTWNGLRCDPFAKFEKITVQEAFLRYAETDLFASIDNPNNPSPLKLKEACDRLRINTAKDDTWEDLFFRIFLEKIENRLGEGAVTILYDYPISMAALSRPKTGAVHVAERFEVYVCGLELANAFGELTDAKVQRARFEADMEKKQSLYGIKYPIDEDFLSALENGFPESAGIALGIDRLVMLATGVDDIEKILWVPVDMN